jgi:hypothetical protein
MILAITCLSHLGLLLYLLCSRPQLVMPGREDLLKERLAQLE